jgi:hypothetical protein
MAESGGLPGWVGAWVSKVVQVHLHGDPDPLLGVLEDWDARGVVLRHTEDMVRSGAASRGGDGPSGPDDDARNLVGGALRLDTAGGARERLAREEGF